jgi:hypothetical protein
MLLRRVAEEAEIAALLFPGHNYVSWSDVSGN